MNDLKHPVSRAIFPIILGACRYRDDLVTEETFDANEVLLALQPHRADFPVLVGKQARQIRAFNTLFETAALRRGQLGKVELREGRTGQPEFERFSYNPKFPVQETRELLEELLGMLFDNPPIVKIEHGQEREKLFINLWFSENDPHNTMITQALNDSFYCYGYRQGIKLRINSNQPNGK